ncbi:DNA-primase RepB domain-containing protein [Halomonas sp. 25-S5]|uniref:DNA-primase RepB domain-containing protein n=1 Tax=Halomonas sp. 25-S5 TaxID=2994065 RepID=UPI00246920CE|nr:DNA-primase RepB domain-containing protein [Halomonas sp. 25-S5]
MIDLQHAQAFLDKLTGSQPVTFQTFDDSDAKRPELAYTLHGTMEQHGAALQALNQRGAGVFVTVNATDLTGRKAENVTAVRGVFVDFDEPDSERMEALAPQLAGAGFEPTIIVESSPGRHHYYWLTRQPGELAPDEFRTIQKALADWLGSDAKVCDLPRVMRLPGSTHRKGDPFSSRMVQEGPRHEAEAIRGAIPAPAPAPAPPAPSPATIPPARRGAGAPARGEAYARSVLDGIEQDIANAPTGERNQVLYQKARRAFSLVHAQQLDVGEVRAVLEGAAAECGLEADEIATTLASAWSASQKEPDDIAPPLAGEGFEAECPPASGDDEEREKSAQLDRIVAFVKARSELFHDDNDTAYIRDRQTGEVRTVGSRAFRNWLTAAFHQQYGKAVRDQPLREARMTLEGLAMQDHRQVHGRVAGASGSYWLDLGRDGDSRAVHLRPGAWSVEGAELMFYRSDSAQPLPEPARGGSIEPLWCIANIPPESRLLVVAWLVECLRPDTPYPIVELLGEQGSAKSTAQTALRRLIDPNAADLRGAPRSAEDLYISGGINHLISLENVSYLPAPLQDAMCVVATGGGFAKRKLYTDGDESVITLKRPIILNGISAAVTQQDLVSRTITVDMPVIKSAQAKDKLDAEFEATRASILGGLLDIAAKALECLPRMELPPDERPRLVEFAYLGMAVAEAMGEEPKAFMRQFEAARLDGLERTLEASPVATAIRAWSVINAGTKDQTTSQWLADLAPYRPMGSDAWPKSAKGLGNALRRAAPALRQLGIECKSLGNIGGHVKWRIGVASQGEASAPSQGEASAPSLRVVGGDHPLL